MITYASIKVNSTSGYVGITQFKFTALVDPAIDSTTKLSWYFGDGSNKQETSPTHIYTSPGIYTVKYVVINSFNDPVESQPIQIEVKLGLSESIYFDYVPPPSFAGHYNRHPFKIIVTSPNVSDQNIILTTINSRSLNHTTPSKWSFLRPECKFFDLKGNRIYSIKTTNTVLKADSNGYISNTGTNVLGVSGYAEFYFSDDIYNADLASSGLPYTTIVATLETSTTKDYDFQTSAAKFLPSLANSKCVAMCPYVSLWRTPSYLNITENGVRRHVNPRWSTSKVPVIVTSKFSTYTDNWPDGKSVSIPKDDSFFVHNYPLSDDNDIPLSIGLKGVSSTFWPTPQFTWTDDQTHLTPGYYKGYFDIPNTNTLSTAITAQLTCKTPELSSNFFNPLIWLSNPQIGQVAVAQYISSKHLGNFNIPPIVQTSFDVPILTTSLSGNHGIYFIAARPYPQYQAWLLDSELDHLYRTNTKGEFLSAINLNSIIVAEDINIDFPDISHPLSLVLDSQENMWIPMANSPIILKLDSKGSLISAVNVLSAIPIVDIEALRAEYQSATFNEPVPAPGETFIPPDIEFYIQPRFIETDIFDNIYVSCYSPLKGMVVKFDSNANILYNTITEALFDPPEIITDNKGDVWLFTSKAISEQGDNIGYIQHKNSDFTTLSSFGLFFNINSFALDNNQNCWFSHNYRDVSKITFISEDTYSIQTLNVSLPNSFSNDDLHTIDGICASVDGNIYVINSVENCVYVINAETVSIENSFFINPQGFVKYYDKDGNIRTSYGYGNKSLRTAGDPTGFNWTNKYSSTYLTPEFQTGSFTLTGISRNLDFYADNTYAYGVAKINEDFNLSNFMKNLAFLPSLQESPVLFDEFFPAIFGSKPLDFGTYLHEKIANFTSNHSDIDTCDIDQLYSISEMVDLNSDDFLLYFPEEIKRLIHLASINPSRLRGSKNINYFNVDNSYTEDISAPINRGDIISSLSYIVSSGTPVVLHHRSIGKYQLIYTGKVQGFGRYSLNMLADYLGLTTEWQSYYDFYEYKYQKEGKQLEGVIDWTNPHTTLNYNTSAMANWSTAEGPLETMFSYELYKGLNLLNY